MAALPPADPPPHRSVFRAAARSPLSYLTLWLSANPHSMSRPDDALGMLLRCDVPEVIAAAAPLLAAGKPRRALG
jgi:hypothetical protein